jgi:hypothetical protein
MASSTLQCPSAYTDLATEAVPGKRFRVRVREEDERVLFTGFRLLA